MVILRLVLLWVLCSMLEAVPTGFYTIVAPRVLRPNSEYHVAVTTQKTSQPTTVTVAVGGKQHGGGVFQATQTVSVEPYTTHIVKLEIGDLGPGTYNLTARGINGLEFTNTTRLDYVHKSHSVFIQTDKAVYKPGHKVQFRAIVLDAHLKPSVTGAMDVYITDGKGNRVKQWSRALTTKGVFSGELQLSQSPVLGDWNITVVVMDQYFYKTFQVAEYVLPKFEVRIDAPAHATFKDSHLAATVHAKYTYGKAVKGEATVTIYPTYYSGLLQPIFQNPVRKVVPIDGKVNVEFDIAKDLKLGDDYERSIQIDVAVEEALTGRRQNTTFEVMVHKYKYKMELIKTSEYFKPGLKYTAFVKLTYHDGSPVQDMNNPVTVRYGYSYDHDSYIEEKYKLSKHGMVELNFYPAVENQTVLGLEAEYLDIKEWFSTVSASMSPSNTFIQAVINTEHPVVNQDIELEINSTEPMKYFSYQVIGRGDVVLANAVQVSDKKTHKFRFLATYVMAPTAHVVVFYVKEDGEIVADALDIELEGSLQNFVNINTNSEETRPGTNVELTFEAKPNSYVGVLGVDQSVLLLKSGNDITEDTVLEELSSYDAGSQTPYWPLLNFRGKRSSYWWPGSATARQVFDNSGAVILTNGLVHEHFPWLYYRSNFNAEGDLQGRLAGVPVPIEAAAFPKSAGTMVPTEPAIRIRSNFPETWLWQMLESGFDGKATIQKTVPDTITSWVISGFSVDPLFGLGLSEAPRKLRVFRPFFLSLDLPYSVVRGETVAIHIVVFNYMSKDLEADVTLENEQLENFEFAEVSNDVNEQPKLELYRRKKVSVRANSGSSVSFMITPKKLGHITIKVTASSPLAGDSVVKKLLVKAEGETQYYNKAIFVDLRNKGSFQTVVTLDVPKNIVTGSDMVEISAVGDILGPSIPNLANLIKMPFGCGEQNMLNFVPNIVVIEYLKNTNQLTPAVEGKALRYMETGYQQELTYRHSDGSFSAFGNNDPSGSTWLTAFVARAFRQAVPYIIVEEKIIQEALHWLSINQASNGSFPEVGKVSHQDMQGGAAKGMALTAYTLIAFLENQQYSNQLYRNTINKALDYIVRNLDGVNDVYALAISSYALNLAQHSAKDAVFNLFESKAQSSGDLKWWQKSLGKDDKKNPWYALPNSVDVEMTAYGLLTYLEHGLVQDALPIMKWLITQRNEQGGFASTQDTVIGLQALAKLAERISSSAVDINVSFSYSGGSPANMKVTRANSMILQKQELPGKVRNIDISASGSGFAVVQVSYHYNLNVTGAWPLFTLDPQVDKNSDSNHLQLSICSGFVGAQGVNESNMAVMEVTLPSGFTVDSDTLPSLQMSQNVKRVETKNGDTVVMLYFDKMTKQEYCPTVSAFRTHKVAKQKPVPVTIYDYYDSSRRARVFYEPRVATLCDICEGEDCSRACSSKPYSHSHENHSSAAARVLLSSVCLFLSSVLLQGWVL
ncbi:CD109 antigen-like isoform X2 [Zootermopsis nevadensis]|uniref:CD109 antigen-like isoform X2 n=1 Tax=Zootermopsis nevadensis TaxID=136037 RepID=UPI000B8E51A9|nr:CD109 antigen-like isoform X2 [Zootermopsis nevadensis]